MKKGKAFSGGRRISVREQLEQQIERLNSDIAALTEELRIAKLEGEAVAKHTAALRQENIRLGGENVRLGVMMYHQLAASMRRAQRLEEMLRTSNAIRRDWQELLWEEWTDDEWATAALIATGGEVHEQWP